MDGGGNAYVTGLTVSPDFPVMPRPSFDTTYNGGTADAFVTKFAATRSRQPAPATPVLVP